MWLIKWYWRLEKGKWYADFQSGWCYRFSRGRITGKNNFKREFMRSVFEILILSFQPQPNMHSSSIWDDLPEHTIVLDAFSISAIPILTALKVFLSSYPHNFSSFEIHFSILSFWKLAILFLSIHNQIRSSIDVSTHHLNYSVYI